VRLNLFTCRDLRKWLDNPCNLPSLEPAADQFLPGLGPVR